MREEKKKGGRLKCYVVAQKKEEYGGFYTEYFFKYDFF